jgi:hypothetical protein
MSLAWTLGVLGCGRPVEGLAETPPGGGPVVRWDLAAEPLPEVPLPNDIATRYDPTSPTGRRLNASVVAPTDFEASLREKLDRLSGWGTAQPFTLAFDRPIDVDTLLAGHRDWERGKGDYDFEDDVVYLIDVTPGSPTYLDPVPIDFGDGNFPEILRRPDLYFEADPKSATTYLLMETWDEDRNRNGRLDPGEDVDLDGRLDEPNVHEMLDGKPGIDLYRDVMTFYERQTNTLTGRPVLPLLPKTTYAMVVTKDLRGENGESVRSPFPWVNHTDQTDDLQPVVDALEQLGRSVDDVAFAWSFTTQAVHDDLVHIRNGLYGAGPMKWLAEDFPAEIDEVFQLRDATDYDGEPVDNVYVIPSDILARLVKPLAQAIFGAMAPQIMENTHRYPAYHVSGSFTTPYFLDLESEDPRFNGVWPTDPTASSMRDRVGARTVYFWCLVPRDEYKSGDPDAPAPVAVYGHGYTNNRLEHLGGFTTNYSKYGIAGCAIDAVDHGIEVDDELGGVLDAFFSESRLGPAGDSLLLGRARDLDGDGVVDSGDTWFGVDAARVRDSFRQSVLDYMVLIRVLRGFDGERTMPVDVDGDGKDELAGDFDGDGDVDLGGPDVDYFATGTSLGGIMSAILAGIEPAVVAAAPISGGAGLTSLVLKSEQGGVYESFGIQGMGPLWIGAPCLDRCTTCIEGCGTNTLCQAACEPDCGEACADGSTAIYQLVANGNDDERYTVAYLDEVEPGDIVMATNLETGKSRCARVLRGNELDPAQLDALPGTDNLVTGDYFERLAGTFRVGLPADAGDRVQLEILAGESDRDVVEIEPEELGCTKKDDVEVRATIDSFVSDVTYQGREYAAGAELVSLEHGMGMLRANPLFRRLVALNGVAAEPGDPVNYAPYYSRYALEFMEGDEVFEKDPTNVLAIVTLGDPAVPVSAGVQIARAAGFFTREDGGAPDELLFAVDPAQGKTLNRVLVDYRGTEAITWLDPFPDYACDLMDFDNFSQSENGPDPDSKDLATDGFDCPRLDPPLRLNVGTFGSSSGRSGLSLPLIEPAGAHAFVVGSNSTWEDFDVGMFMSNQIAVYFGTRGQQIAYNRCMEQIAGCPFLPVPKGIEDDPCATGEDCYSGECTAEGLCTGID